MDKIKSITFNKDVQNNLSKEVKDKMREDRKQAEKKCDIHVVMCSSCKREIKQEDEKHAFWEEDINDGIPLKCLDCHLETESICRDFGF